MGDNPLQADFMMASAFIARWSSFSGTARLHVGKLVGIKGALSSAMWLGLSPGGPARFNIGLFTPFHIDVEPSASAKSASLGP
jgi:hypothetical protein